MADTARTRPGTEGGITSPDYWEARWKQARADAAADTALAIGGPEGHTASEWHSGRFRFVLLGCDFGVPGTSLTQTGLWGHRVIRFPLELVNWHAAASPAAGNAVVDVLLAANLEAFAAGTYASICGGSGNRPTLASQRVNAGAVLGVWSTVKLAPDNVLIWQLVSASGALEVLSTQLEARRT
jgi:hypothetical protein